MIELLHNALIPVRANEVINNLDDQRVMQIVHMFNLIR